MKRTEDFTAEEVQIIHDAGYITEDELRTQMGKIDFGRRLVFHGTSGGQSDDSLRGFGSTSQCSDFATANGWMVTWHDNSFYDWHGISGATSPEGVRWSYEEVKLPQGSGAAFKINPNF